MRQRPTPPLMYWNRLTRAQMEALLAVYKRRFGGKVIECRAGHGSGGHCTHCAEVLMRQQAKREYLKFRRTARLDRVMNCVMVPYAGMWLGIEPDGYTHS